MWIISVRREEISMRNSPKVLCEKQCGVAILCLVLKCPTTTNAPPQKAPIALIRLMRFTCWCDAQQGRRIEESTEGGNHLQERTLKKV